MTLRWRIFPEAWRGAGLLHIGERAGKQIKIVSRKRPRLVFYRQKGCITVAAPGTKRTADGEIGTCTCFRMDEVFPPVVDGLEELAGMAEEKLETQ